MRTRFVNEAEEEMTFPFYAPKEDNEVEEDNERNFLENMRIRSVNEGEDEKLYVLGEIKEEGHFCLNRVNFFAF